MSKQKFFYVAVFVVVSTFSTLLPWSGSQTAPRNIAKAQSTSVDDFNGANAKNNLISDTLFTNLNSMAVTEIQNFLENKNSYLKDFSEGGRSAAQIIYDAAHGAGDASDSNGSTNGIAINGSTGTVSPKVLLVTLQKEQSLITKSSRDDRALAKAMGYACPDNGSANDTNNNGCNDSFEGFAKQVETAAWQFRYNYEAALKDSNWRNTNYVSKGREVPFYVGQSTTFDDSNGSYQVTIGNAATASLYRYTPHVFNGNYNFWKFYKQWFEKDNYSYSWMTAGPYSGPGSATDPISPGYSTQLWVVLENTGSETWKKNAVNLGQAGPRDRGSAFTGGENLRMILNEEQVAPGATGTFRINITAPSRPGIYNEHFAMVVEGVKWLDQDLNWRIIVGNPLSTQYVNEGQEPHTSDAKVHLSPGQSKKLTVRFVNNSGANWYRDGSNAIHLGQSHPRDRASVFEGGENIRGIMREGGIGFGDTGTFDVTITAPDQTGEYREYYDLVVEGVGWIETGLYWDIVVE